MAQEQAIDTFRGSTARWLAGSLEGWLILLLCLVGIGFILLGLKWLSNRSVAFDLTDQRLIIRKGIVNKSIDEIELYRVKDVTVAFSLLGQMADIGDIAIVSSDVTSHHSVMTMRDIPEARRRREALRQLVEASRRLRGVRELDMDAVNL